MNEERRKEHKVFLYFQRSTENIKHSHIRGLDSLKMHDTCAHARHFQARLHLAVCLIFRNRSFCSHCFLFLEVLLQNNLTIILQVHTQTLPASHSPHVRQLVCVCLCAHRICFNLIYVFNLMCFISYNIILFKSQNINIKMYHFNNNFKNQVKQKQHCHNVKQ